MTARLAALTLVCVIAGCGDRTLPPLGQIVMYIDTDAPVPAAPGEPETTALFDRIRIEVFANGKPVADANRDFAVHAGMFRERRVSVGIVPPRGERVVTRVSLFRGDRAIDGAPPAEGSLVVVARHPAVGEEGIVDTHVALHVDELGKPRGTLEAPIDASPGTVGASEVGRWTGAQQTACKSGARPEELCIHGGAFWFGDPAFRGRSQNDIANERLVVLSPYFLDRREVTVQEFRAAWPSLEAKGVLEPTAWNGRRVGDQVEDWCTWVKAPAGEDSTGTLPLNCVSWTTASAYCAEQGKDLPTEAQFEFAASGLGREWSYPWGHEDPSCTDAVWGRGGVGVLSVFASDCRPPGSLGWSAPPGEGARDRVGARALAVPDGELLDLGGNVSEWMRDRWSLPSDPFWSPVKIYSDPSADYVRPMEDGARPVRGGSWLQPSRGSRAAFRLRNDHLDRVRGIGFRCARK